MRAHVSLFALVLCGCHNDEAPKPTATATATSEHPPIERMATPGELAVHNLEQSLKQSEGALKKQPKSMVHRESVVTVLLQRASFLGRVSDYTRALKVAEETVTMFPNDAHSYRLRAKTLSAVHRFQDALADLDKAEEMRTSKNDTRSQRGTILLALGKIDEGYQMLHEQRKKFPMPDAMALEAAALGTMGKYEEADKLFQDALAKYRGTSPFVIGWNYFERGSMWDKAGDRDRARTLYRQAVKTLPVYAHAIGHLAVLVPPAEAEALLVPIVKSSDDPEYLAILGGVLEKHHAGAGKQILEQAKQGYDRLMKEMPLAFADHAGWFYLDAMKDPARAVEVAEMNLKARQPPEAYELAIAAELASGDKADACETADKALELKYLTPGVKARAAAAYEACGKKDRAAELKKELETKR